MTLNELKTAIKVTTSGSKIYFKPVKYVDYNSMSNPTDYTLKSFTYNYVVQISRSSKGVVTCSMVTPDANGVTFPDPQTSNSQLISYYFIKTASTSRSAWDMVILTNDIVITEGGGTLYYTIKAIFPVNLYYFSRVVKGANGLYPFLVMSFNKTSGAVSETLPFNSMYPAFPISEVIDNETIINLTVSNGTAYHNSEIVQNGDLEINNGDTISFSGNIYNVTLNTTNTDTPIIT